MEWNFGAREQPSGIPFALYDIKGAYIPRNLKFLNDERSPPCYNGGERSHTILQAVSEGYYVLGGFGAGGNGQHMHHRALAFVGVVGFHRHPGGDLHPVPVLVVL